MYYLIYNRKFKNQNTSFVNFLTEYFLQNSHIFFCWKFLLITDTQSKNWYFAFTVKCLSASFFRTAKLPSVGTKMLVCMYNENIFFCCVFLVLEEKSDLLIHELYWFKYICQSKMRERYESYTKTFWWILVLTENTYIYLNHFGRKVQKKNKEEK